MEISKKKISAMIGTITAVVVILCELLGESING